MATKKVSFKRLYKNNNRLLNCFGVLNLFQLFWSSKFISYHQNLIWNLYGNQKSKFPSFMKFN
jgi:hypothetical protein